MVRTPGVAVQDIASVVPAGESRKTAATIIQQPTTLALLHLDEIVLLHLHLFDHVVELVIKADHLEKGHSIRKGQRVDSDRLAAWSSQTFPYARSVDFHMHVL